LNHPYEALMRFQPIMICISGVNVGVLAWRRKSKIGWLGIRIICPSGATWLSADCCFIEFVLWNSN